MTGQQALAVLVASLTLFQAAWGGKPEESAQPKAGEPASHHDTPHWSYEEAAGPAKWATLSPQWAICGEGRSQSPIDIEKTSKVDLPRLEAEFKPASLKIIHHEHVADVINNGHTVQVNYTEGDTLKVGDEQFELLQYHFHSPSEHTVGGKSYPMEMHMVHRSSDGKLAVVGVFIAEGRHNAAFDPIWSNLPKSKGKQNHLEHVKVDVNSLLPARKTTYRYEGSLTTPPCSEGVKWILMATPIQLSAKQIAAFRHVVKGNNRPVQALGGRSVQSDRLLESSSK